MHISDYHRLIAVLRMESDVLSLESVTGHDPAMSLWKSEVLPITLHRHISLHVSSVLSRLVFMVSTSAEVSRYCGRPYQTRTDAKIPTLKVWCLTNLANGLYFGYFVTNSVNFQYTTTHSLICNCKVATLRNGFL